jgi:hypothetical protein
MRELRQRERDKKRKAGAAAVPISPLTSFSQLTLFVVKYGA